MTSLELDQLSPPKAAPSKELTDAPDVVVAKGTDGKAQEEDDDRLDLRALFSLAAQHVSSTWGQRSYEFASYLYLITLFPDTLLPASIFGFCGTGLAIIGAGYIGNLVDARPRLQFVRACVVLQKASVCLAYACFLILFLHFRTAARVGTDSAVVWGLFGMVVVFSAVLNLATIAISVSIERDWVTVVAQGSSMKLTRLNTYLRRIDLVTKLLAPLFVSLLTTTVSYPFSVAFLLGFGLVSMVFEFIWIDVVYRRLPILGEEEAARNVERKRLREEARITAQSQSLSQRVGHSRKQILPSLKQMACDWKEFILSPIFPSSLAIALLYLSVLSFDGAMLSFLKSHNWSDAFLAGMRGVCVVTGLIGTVGKSFRRSEASPAVADGSSHTGMPWMENRIGVVRTGTWSILAEVVCLIPVLLSMFVRAPAEGERGLAWNAAMLFAGMALSRIGLWSFDLCQLKELQMTLQDHPRRNSLTALQYSLQNVLDLLKYSLTMVLYRPSQFKWAALVSFASVSMGAFSYLYYSRQERGHIFHLGWTELLLRKTK